MSSLRVSAPRTFTDENAVYHDRVSTKQSGVATRRGLGAPLNKPSAPTASSASTNPPKPTTASTTSTTRRALGDITNATKPAAAPSADATTHGKQHRKPAAGKKLTTTVTATTATTTSLVQPPSPPPIELPLGMTWREQEERVMDELGTRRDSLTGLTPAELTSSISSMLAATDKRLYTCYDDRLMTGWVRELDVAGGDDDGDGGGGGVGGVDERKVQALLELDLDIDLDL